MNDFECPYCQHEMDYNGDGLGQDDSSEEQCPECEKNFIIHASWNVDYTASKADCLNGSPHKWRKQACAPAYWADIICDECGSTHRPSEEERVKFGIPLREETA